MSEISGQVRPGFQPTEKTFEAYGRVLDVVFGGVEIDDKSGLEDKVLIDDLRGVCTDLFEEGSSAHLVKEMIRAAVTDAEDLKKDFNRPYANPESATIRTLNSAEDKYIFGTMVNAIAPFIKSDGTYNMADGALIVDSSYDRLVQIGFPAPRVRELSQGALVVLQDNIPLLAQMEPGDFHRA